MKAEKVLKAFYTQVQQEQKAFQLFVMGIPGELTREYVAVLLNRLMFLYFLQKKGFLAADYQYLRTKLTHFVAHAPERYFAAFLCPLFFEGFAKPLSQRSSVLKQLFGDLPYFQETIFRKHQAETQFSQTLQIADVAFERLFTFFERYTWRLDAPLLGQETDLNPTLLGYLFEKQINQKEMGAYYTKEDITEYLSKNTIIPALLHRVQKRIPHFFESEQALWQLLRQNPPRYLYEAVKHGLELPLPEAIAKGLNDVKQRGAWQQTAPKTYALPTETWREVVARRQRANELLRKLANGEINQINDLITYNLDICQFVQDVIEECEDHELLNAIWQALQTLTVLDLTCGSGAFLFAALTILEPLYTACLQRFESFAPENPVFQPILAQAAKHPNRAYFLLKTIMLNNLYGVDLMPEALEICKLRLFLKLIAQLAEVSELDLLPNLDSNLRVGNSLVGFVQKEAAKDNPQALEPQQPFHWFREFPNVMQRGGFEVIIGNPPYVEYNETKFSYKLRDFTTLACANLYPCMIERSHFLLNPHGYHGMIVPLAAFATKRMTPLLDNFQKWFAKTWISFYHFRPSMLFAGGKAANIPIAIYIATTGASEERFSSNLAKWTAENRVFLFTNRAFCALTAPRDAENSHYYAKISCPIENELLTKILKHPKLQNYLTSAAQDENELFYRSAGGLYWKIFLNFAWPYESTSNKRCAFRKDYDRDLFVALLNSSLFWWYYTTTFDTFNLKNYMLFGFRFSYPNEKKIIEQLKCLTSQLMDDFKRNAKDLQRGKTASYTVYAKQSKPIIDEIDKVLAQHYGFTPEELDFILNYDLKYRLGKQ